MKEFAVFPLDLLLLGACQPAPAAEPTMPVAALPSPNVPGIGRALLVYEDLMNGFEFEEPQAESALTLPEGTIPAIHIFEGWLELLGEKENGHIQLLRGETGPEYACLLVRRRGEGGQLHRRLPDAFRFVSLRPIDGSIGDASGKKACLNTRHPAYPQPTHLSDALERAVRDNAGCRTPSPCLPV